MRTAHDSDVRCGSSHSHICILTDKPVLEFVAIQRKDNHQWAIPGGMVEPGDNVSLTLRKEFSEEALAKLNMDADKSAEITEKLQ